MTQGWHREPRSADCDYGCEYRWTLRHGWQMAPNLACREHIRERGRDVLGDLHAVYGETQEGVPIMTGDLPEPVAFARGGYVGSEYVVNVESNISRANMDALLGRGIPDPMNNPTRADLYPDDEPSPWMPWDRPDADVIGDIRRVRGGYTVTHEGRTPGEIIREYGRLYGAGEVVHEEDPPRYADPRYTVADMLRDREAARETLEAAEADEYPAGVRDPYPVSRSMGAAWDEYPLRMREHVQRLRDAAFAAVDGVSQEDMDTVERYARTVLGLTPDRVIVDDDEREWEAIDPRRRQAIANWTMTDRGRSGLLGKGDYPPGALVRNPPGLWTPEAHP